MFKKDRSPLQGHNLWISSQFTCPWENTLLTLKVSPSASRVYAYVEQIVDAQPHEDQPTDGADSKKRTRDDSAKYNKPMPYLPKAMPYLPKGDKEEWTDLGDGLKHRSFDGAFMKDKLPNIGVRMCGCLGNRVEIVPSGPSPPLGGVP